MKKLDVEDIQGYKVQNGGLVQELAPLFRFFWVGNVKMASSRSRLLLYPIFLIEHELAHYLWASHAMSKTL